MRQDCEAIIAILESCAPYEWAQLFVAHKMRFWRQYCLGLIFTTSHGADFFTNVIACLDGKMKWTEEGEYNDNFRKFIKHYKGNERTVLGPRINL